MLDVSRRHSRRRWSDNDFDVGPLTFAWSKYHSFGVMLCSGDDEYRAASLRFHAWPLTVLLALPAWLVPPQRRKVFPDWDAATVSRLGRNWYYDVTRREFGFSFHGGGGHDSVLFSVHYGRQTMDSSSEKSWGKFLPWTCWRHVRHSLYGLDGELFLHLPQRRFGDPGAWEEHHRLEESCPTQTFAFRDFDGEELTATTKIEEREWKLGEGWFKWLSLFRKPKIRRSLDIHFSGETGKRKGSWKGGTIGHSIDMQPGELHEAAFRRYCTENGMQFQGAVR